MTFSPKDPAGSSSTSSTTGGPIADSQPFAVAPVASGPRRGYRARLAREISDLVAELAQQVASDASQALPTDSSRAPGTITLVTAPVADWYPMLRGVLEAERSVRGPVRGTADLVTTAAAAVPPALAAIEPVARGLARWIKSFAISTRGPSLTEAEVGGLWLNALVEALLPQPQSQPRRGVRLAEIGTPKGQEDDSYYLLSTVAYATLTWHPSRWLFKISDEAVAQWLLTTISGDLIGGGIVRSGRPAKAHPLGAGTSP